VLNIYIYYIKKYFYQNRIIINKLIYTVSDKPFLDIWQNMMSATFIIFSLNNNSHINMVGI
jgi:hypothetical protein